MIGIIVAFPKEETGKKIKNILIRSGFHNVSVCTTDAQVLQTANEIHSGVVICAYRLGYVVYWQLKEDLPVGFEMITITSPEQWASNGVDGIVNLSQPLKVHDLLSTLEMVAYNVELSRKRRKKQPRTRSAEEERMIKKAKDILMSRNNMSEEEAHRYLQKTSMDNATSFTETAQMILSMMDN